MKIIPEEVPNLTIEEKKELHLAIKRNINILCKLFKIELLLLFIISGFCGWLVLFGGGMYIKMLILCAFGDMFIILCLVLLENINKTNIIFVAIIQIIIMILTKMVLFFPIVNLFFIYKLYKDAPLYHALKKEEGFPCFFDRNV